MISIEICLLTVWLNPDLVLSVFREDVEACDIQFELEGFCEFAETSAGANKLLFTDVGGHLEDLGIDVVTPGVMESENKVAVFSVDQEFDIGPKELGKFVKKDFGLVVC